MSCARERARVRVRAGIIILYKSKAPHASAALTFALVSFVFSARADVCCDRWHLHGCVLLLLACRSRLYTSTGAGTMAAFAFVVHVHVLAHHRNKHVLSANVHYTILSRFRFCLLFRSLAHKTRASKEATTTSLRVTGER